MQRSRAAVALSRWLQTSKKSQLWLAGKVGVHQTTLSLYLRGSEPKASAAVALERVTGVKVEWWGESARAA